MGNRQIVQTREELGGWGISAPKEAKRRLSPAITSGIRKSAAPFQTSGSGMKSAFMKQRHRRRVSMVMVHVAERAAGRGDADGAVVLSIEIMEHAGGKDEDKDDENSPFHQRPHYPMDFGRRQSVKTAPPGDPATSGGPPES